MARAVGVRSVLVTIAAGPAVTIGLLGAIATLAGALHVAFTPATVGVVIVVVGLGGATSRYFRGRPFEIALAKPSFAALCSILMVVVGLALAVRTWLRGFRGLSTVAQEHDMITHQLLVAYIGRTGRAAPWQVQPVDLLTGGPVSTYPAGGHLGPALLAGAGADPSAALNAFTITYLAVGFVIGVCALSVVTARQLGCGAQVSSLAGGVGAVIAPALYRPTFQLMHDGGVYPNAVTLALAPGLLAAFLAAPAERSRSAIAVVLGFACAGLVTTHPSAVATVAVSLVAWLCGDLLDRHGRRRLVRLLPVLLGAGAVAAIGILPLLLSSTSTVGGIAGFPPDTGATGFAQALGSTIGLSYGGYLDNGRLTGQAGLTALVLVGVFLVARARRGVGVVAAWATWSAIVFAMMLSPGIGPEASVTGLFYNALQRVWAHTALFVPTLAAIAVVLSSAAVVRVTRRHLPVALRTTILVPALVLAAAAALVAAPVSSGARTNTISVAERYGEPEFRRFDTHDAAAIDFLRSRVAPGQRVMNSANDGSTLLYVQAGIPVVNTTSLGTGSVPWSIPLLASFRDYPERADIRSMLRELDVAWVYVDDAPPGIGAGGSPYGWVSDPGPFTVPPGLEDLDVTQLPGLTKQFQSGPVSVYRLSLDSLP
ncbi:DUF6541 family protein [Pseudonocardia tropica]|uniref:DUF6541 family protein n=1 Tax=Pseudonocardia tropica TaxID=681289 RepID=A0ABV1JNG8_9PSEU